MLVGDHTCSHTYITFPLLNLKQCVRCAFVFILGWIDRVSLHGQILCYLASGITHTLEICLTARQWTSLCWIPLRNRAILGNRFWFRTPQFRNPRLVTCLTILFYTSINNDVKPCKTLENPAASHPATTKTLGTSINNDAKPCKTLENPLRCLLHLSKVLQASIRRVYWERRSYTVDGFLSPIPWK